jgi:hypothetical protein
VRYTDTKLKVLGYPEGLGRPHTPTFLLHPLPRGPSADSMNAAKNDATLNHKPYLNSNDKQKPVF